MYPFSTVMTKILQLIPLLGLSLLLGSCASVTALPTEAEPPNPTSELPDRVYVRDFAVPAENLRVDREGKRLIAFQDDIADKLTATLVKQLDRSFAPAEVLPADAEVPHENAWLIVGEIDQMNQGSRALRTAIGFGAGGTKVITTAAVHDLSTSPPTPILSIRTIGGSNATPGTVANISPLTILGPIGLGIGTVAVGAWIRAFPGLTDDLRRTAREITATLSAYSAEEGLIPAEDALAPKPVGAGTVRLHDRKRRGS